VSWPPSRTTCTPRCAGRSPGGTPTPRCASSWPLGWYWVLRGQPGEPETLAHAVLSLEPRERSRRIAEARMVCAMTAAGPSWEIDRVQPALSAAVADFAVLSHGEPPSNPVAAMAEPMLVLSERDPERAFVVFDRYMASADPWVRAAVRCCAARSAACSAASTWPSPTAGTRWLRSAPSGTHGGAASVLIQVAELAQLRGGLPHYGHGPVRRRVARPGAGRLGGPFVHRRLARRGPAQDGRSGTRPDRPGAGRACPGRAHCAPERRGSLAGPGARGPALAGG